jgi:hypothetical protein
MLATKTSEVAKLKEYTWEEVREEVKAVNPKLYEIIEQLSPPKKFGLYKFRYPYGMKIIDNGRLNIPLENGKSSFLSDTTAQKSLSYRSIPLALVLRNASEVFIEDDDRIVPMRLLKPGDLFGVFEALDPPDQESSASVTNVSAGARSAFMLAKISNSINHKRLTKELGLRSPLPNGLVDHGLMFAEIAHRTKTTNPWYNEILFFSAEWFKERPNDAGWLRFTRYLHEVAWQQSQYWRTLTTFGLLWKTLVKAITARNIRPRQYLVDTIKHLIFMTTGAVPGFAPIENEEAIPAKIIQEAYLNVYLLKSHSPILWVPHHFSLNQPEDSVYYSLSYPTLLEYSFNPKQAPTIIEDVREIKLLLELLGNRPELQNDQTYHIVKKAIFGFYTCDTDIEGKITSSADLPLIDRKLSDKNRTFPHTSTFLRGCIRISNK